jgi:hypothetical protein
MAGVASSADRAAYALEFPRRLLQLGIERITDELEADSPALHGVALDHGDIDAGA